MNFDCFECVGIVAFVEGCGYLPIFYKAGKEVYRGEYTPYRANAEQKLDEKWGQYNG